MQIEIINNNKILKTWYRNIAANLRHFQDKQDNPFI